METVFTHIFNRYAFICEVREKSCGMLKSCSLSGISKDMVDVDIGSPMYIYGLLGSILVEAPLAKTECLVD